MGSQLTVRFFEARKVHASMPWSAVEAGLKAAHNDLAARPVDEILEALGQFGRSLLQRDLPLHAKYAGYGTAFLAAWLKKTTLSSVLGHAFGDIRYLDAFQPLAGRADRQARAYPRGMVLHLMAGNVPTLGVLSLTMGLLTKNANVIRQASGADDFLPDLLAQLAASEAGRAVASCIAVLEYDHAQADLAGEVSLAADCRVMWGGNDAVRSMRSLPSKPDCQDCAFPHRTAFAAVDRDSLLGAKAETVARQLARDATVFEQKACASPHTVFLETTDQEVLDGFAALLVQEMERCIGPLPTLTLSAKETSAILNLRAQYDMFHKSYSPKGLGYSILLDQKLQLGPSIGNRTIFLRPVGRLEDIALLVTAEVQSVALTAEGKRYDELCAFWGRLGVQRIVRPGGMTLFESPWDGKVMPQGMVRWTTRAV